MAPENYEYLARFLFVGGAPNEVNYLPLACYRRPGGAADFFLLSFLGGARAS